MKEKLKEMERELGNFSLEWEPYCYNVFIIRIEETIELLQKMITEFNGNINREDKKQLKQAIALLQEYLRFREKHS